jgi:hypothetical protein
MIAAETSPTSPRTLLPSGKRDPMPPSHLMRLPTPVDGLADCSATPQSPQRGATMTTLLSVVARLRVTPPSSLRLDAHRSSPVARPSPAA